MKQQQLSIEVNSTVYARLNDLAQKAGLRVSQYAQLLFDAAYAARSGKSLGDGELDAWVGACMLLYAAGTTVEAIAGLLGTSPKVVNRMLVAWRRVLSEERAA